MGGTERKNLVPDSVKQMPQFKAFFDGIAIILASMKAQNTKKTKIVKLPKSVDMGALSNYGITIQHWFDHNFAEMHGITIEWK